MKKKYIISAIIFIFLFTFSVQSENINFEYIQELINNQEREKALNVLKEIDISDNPDLRFYEALLLSWKDEFEKSEQKLLSLIEEYPARFDFYAQLAKLYEWMDKPYKSLEFRKKAYERAKGTQYEKEYLELLKIARERVEPTNFAKLEFIHDINKEQGTIATNILLGQQRIISDNIDLTGSAGLNYKKNLNYLLRTELELNSFNFIKNLSFKNSNNFILNKNENKIDLYNNLNYKINGRNEVGFNLNSFNVFSNENSRNYQNINFEYKHKWDKLVSVIGVTARNDESGLTLDFSQNIEIYYPLDKYLFSFNLSHYKGNQYVFRTGIELTNIELNSNWIIKNLNGWFNNEKSAKLNLRFERN